MSGTELGGGGAYFRDDTVLSYALDIIYTFVRAQNSSDDMVYVVVVRSEYIVVLQLQ